MVKRTSTSLPRRRGTRRFLQGRWTYPRTPNSPCTMFTATKSPIICTGSTSETSSHICRGSHISHTNRCRRTYKLRSISVCYITREAYVFSWMSGRRPRGSIRRTQTQSHAWPPVNWSLGLYPLCVWLRPPRFIVVKGSFRKCWCGIPRHIKHSRDSRTTNSATSSVSHFPCVGTSCVPLETTPQ